MSNNIVHKIKKYESRTFVTSKKVQFLVLNRVVLIRLIKRIRHILPMRYIFSFLCILIFAFNSTAQSAAEGIIFILDDFAEATRRAKAENKLIFLDAHTTWCAPCKKMAKETFTDDSVALQFNTRFINLNMDMERGVGVVLAQKYAILAYPTLLFLDTEGVVVHKALGFQDAEGLLNLGDVAFSGSDNLAAWQKRYVEGDTSAEFLREYADKLNEVIDPKHYEVVEKYLATQKDWLTEENLDFIIEHLPSSVKNEGNTEGGMPFKLFRFFAENKPAFGKRMKPELVETRLQDILGASILNEKKLPSLGFADTLTAIVFGEKTPQTKQQQLKYRLDFYRMKGDRPNFGDAAARYFKKYDENADELSDVALTFFQEIDDKKMLKKATKWTRRAIKLDNSYLNHLLLAQLYQKIGKNEDALEAAQNALSLAEQNKEDASEAKILMDSLTVK